MNEEREKERFVEMWNAFADKNGLPMIEEMCNFSLIYGTYSKDELDEYIINPLFNPARKYFAPCSVGAVSNDNPAAIANYIMAHERA